MASDIGILAAFLAGILSFASPCVLPLIPAFLSYLGGIGLHEGEKASRSRIFLHSLSYVLGFTFVFSLMGVLLSSAFSPLAYSFRPLLEKLAGLLIILFGFYLLGIFKPDFLSRERRTKPSHPHNSYLFSFLFGASFAVGWSPCVGAMLGAILALAAASPANSFLLLFTYSLGLGIPFLLAGAFIAQSRSLIKSASPYLKYFNLIAGILLILLGILVFTDSLSLFTTL